jgi:Type II secretion system (T2SS), protein K
MIERPKSVSRIGRRETGSALLIVLWALLILAGSLLAWSQWISQDITLDIEANRGLEARAMAHSGMAVALNPQVSKSTPLLAQAFPYNTGYHVKIISEGGKLNVNWFMQGEDPQKVAFFKKWLAYKGLNLQEREIFTDCLLDYIDPDNQRHPNGVEDQGDYHAANRPLLSVDEITKVWGAGPLTKIPGWKDDLTIDSQGPIDLVAAPDYILRLLGFSELAIKHFLQMRAGPDKIDGTADDYEFKDINEVLMALGMTPEMAQQSIGPLVIANDKTLRITSVGYSTKVVRQLEVVVRKAGGNPQIRSWKE